MTSISDASKKVAQQVADVDEIVGELSLEAKSLNQRVGKFRY